ncbi:hypothetical protein [Clostridium pasteurianum]|uniref:Uncharacterized protein n=1 Tax=Clostridium pasteurianum BC1 TaxID=86416 RepID=R4K5S1_CLOPA|nr:hypothetical protein [Clostridium pasteurianum]AGK97026.1 hypothetical protein Clopa_2148 [Clostridium pasteurianum BC1]
MLNKKKLAGLGMIIIIIILGLIVLISPVRSIAWNNSDISSNTKDNFFKSLDTIQFDRQDNNLHIGFLLTEKDLNNLLYGAIKDKIKVNAMETDINADSISIYINSYLFNKISTQYMLEFIPFTSGDKLVLNLKSAKIGRISIPKNLVLNRLKKSNSNYMTINNTNNSINIDGKILEPFKISDFKLEGDKLRFNLTYSIKSLQDIKNLFSYEIPDNIKAYAENLFK